MTDTLEAAIDAARRALRDAAEELDRLVQNMPAASRASKVEVSDVVRAAIDELAAARAKLAGLEEAMAAAKLDVARAVLGDAEAELDGAVSKMQTAAQAEESWVPEGVEAAFTKLRAARRRVLELEGRIPDDD